MGSLLLNPNNPHGVSLAAQRRSAPFRGKLYSITPLYTPLYSRTVLFTSGYKNKGYFTSVKLEVSLEINARESDDNVIISNTTTTSKKNRNTSFNYLTFKTLRRWIFPSAWV
jgi:hypothetical protein